MPIMYTITILRYRTVFGMTNKNTKQSANIANILTEQCDFEKTI